MGLMDWFKPKGKVGPTPVQQGQVMASTPIPRFDDYGGDGAQLSSHFYATDGPTPAHIEWIFGLSDEFARTIRAIRMGVWRQGLKIEPVHPKFCSACGEGIDDDMQPCPGCAAVGTAQPPNPAERSRLKDFLKVANKTTRESLLHIGERKTEEGLKHGRSYLIFKMDYKLKNEPEKGLQGVVDTSAVKGVYAGLSSLIERLEPNKFFICLRCRSNEKYQAEKEPGNCGCGFTLYEAYAVQHQTVMGGAIERWWLAEEVHETRWPYTDGSSPVRRLWPKLSTLLMMDWYAAWALDPKRDKRPDKILVTIGGTKESLKAWAKEDSEMRKKNPYKLSHLHIESPPGGLNDLKAAAEVLDLGEKEFKGQMLELRLEFEAAVRKHYGVTALQGGDTDEVGGLGSSKVPQIKAGATTEESVQLCEEEWLLRLAEKLGCRQWTFKFHPPMEEDDGLEADTTNKWLDVAKKAADNGLTVEWREGRPRIMDGPVQKQEVPNPFGGDGESKGGAEDDGDFPDFVKQAISSSGQVGKQVLVELRGPAGFTEVEDELFSQFSGLPRSAAVKVREEIAASLSQPQGWSTDSIVRRIKKHWVDAGFSPELAASRAETVARTEVRSIASEFKRKLWKTEEADRGQKFMYHIRGASDHRTTKLSHWTRRAVGEGKTLEEVEAILDAGVKLAKAGAFGEGGALSKTTPGKPIVLPPDFERRGFIIHFNDRDQVFRVS